MIPYLSSSGYRIVRHFFDNNAFSHSVVALQLRWEISWERKTAILISEWRADMRVAVQSELLFRIRLLQFHSSVLG